MLRFAPFFLFCLAVVGAALAKGTPTMGPPARPALARAIAPCDAKCDWIVLQGFIDKTTLADFRKLLKTLGRAKPPVFLNSGGGDVDSALEIGRLIRAKGLDTAVAASTLAEGPPPPGKAAPVRAQSTAVRAFCASACSFVLAGGVRRLVGRGVPVGVHEIVIPEQDAEQRVRFYLTQTFRLGRKVISKQIVFVREQKFTRHIQRHDAPEAHYRKVAAYFDAMKVDAKKLVALMKTATPEQISWLSAASLTETRLATETNYADSLLALTPPPAPPPRQVAEAQSVAAPRAGAIEMEPLLINTGSSPSLVFLPLGAAAALLVAIFVSAPPPRRNKPGGAQQSAKRRPGDGDGAAA